MFEPYRLKHVPQLTELRAWEEGEDMSGISVSDDDQEAGSPQEGDMIARDPASPANLWLVTAERFTSSFEPA